MNGVAEANLKGFDGLCSSSARKKAFDFIERGD